MNSPKNILLITPFFFPELISTGKFNTDMIIALRDQGHYVKVLCFHPFYPKWKVEYSNEKLDNIEIIRGGKNNVYTQKNILRRFILEISFSFFVLRKIFKHQKNTDIIIPVFPPSFAFYAVSPFLNKRIVKVGIIHDLQEVYMKGKKGIVYKWIGKIIHHLERKVFKSCDRLIFLSEEMKNIGQEYYQLNASKLKAQFPFVTINPNKKEKLNKLEILLPDHLKHIVYSGALGEKQNPNALINLFNYCSDKLPQLKFHVFSQGFIFEELKKKNINKKIEFHDLVSNENIEELYQRSFIQFIPQSKGTSKGSLPSKLPNLLASKCNIICITDVGSDIDVLFQKHQLKKIVTSWDKQLILNSIEEYLEEEDPDFTKQNEISRKLFNINSMINSILEN
ncbi:MAG: glycosyltransferase [Polaribacter sp.]|jgi:colanic acid biosynthesis glycosyl transferase WcaI|nr:glycosyltransferase [Polaribacter sp.]MDG1528392.1 glycosyltransferase [Polaribacter sp.]MDG1954889.1 glycosyltransferase [Polaribacter sp.]MDG2074089.1 glycosyltransferase [Polaribacter sp.]